MTSAWPRGSCVNPTAAASASLNSDGLTVTSGGSVRLRSMPSSASPRIAAVAKYGLADGSTAFTSTLAPRGFASPSPTNLTAASRFSVPQQTCAPDQKPGCIRSPETIDPDSTPCASGSPARSPPIAASPAAVIPWAPDPPPKMGLPERVSEKCWCAPDPTLPANGTGERLQRIPCLRAMRPMMMRMITS